MASRKTAAPLTEAQVQGIARALSDPRRFAMLEQIAGAPVLSCTALNAHQEVSPATISHHLKELSEAGLVHMEREGRTAKLSLVRPVWDAYRKRLAAL